MTNIPEKILSYKGSPLSNKVSPFWRAYLVKPELPKELPPPCMKVLHGVAPLATAPVVPPRLLDAESLRHIIKLAVHRFPYSFTRTIALARINGVVIQPQPDNWKV